MLTGEDIYLKEDFIKLIDMGAVDMIHPDLASSGGLIETKKIGDYAMEHGVPMAMHFAGTPGLVHGERAHRGGHRELHRARASLARRPVVGRAGHDDRRKPLVDKGFAPVPDAPGLGVEPIEEAVRAAPAAGQRLLRADAAVGQGALLGQDVELTGKELQAAGSALGFRPDSMPLSRDTACSSSQQQPSWRTVAMRSVVAFVS